MDCPKHHKDNDVVEPVDYINTIAAACSSHESLPIANGYRYLVKFFRSALLDRTETVQPGFPYRILDPIPSLRPDLPALTALCDLRGRELITEAQAKDKTIRILWSGGIDSTTALIALLKAAEELKELERIQVFYNRSSICEYRRFFKKIIQPRLSHQRIKTVATALAPDALIVTGEHGDQIFGSVLARDYIKPGGFFWRQEKRLFEPWQEVLLPILKKCLGNGTHAVQAQAVLLPQLKKSPISLVTLFDLLWWVNFSMKWQLVSLRLAAQVPEHYSALRQATRHFFCTDDFQRWSLSHHEEKIDQTWNSYKMPLKYYINDYFPDQKYLKHKLKIPSLTKLTKVQKDRIYDRQISVEIHYVTILSGPGDSCADGDGE